MLTRRSRTGFTLVEMVVALTLTGVTLALVSAIALRQQRVVAELADRREVSTRLREASVLLPIQLRLASPGDIREARDTSLELRATIATSFVCDTAAAELVLVPATESKWSTVFSPIEAGDSVWVWARDDSIGWRGTRVTAVASNAAGPCNALGPMLSEVGLHSARVRLAVAPMPAMSLGIPVRVTRPMRYSLYRAADGDWYVGLREWNNALARFNSVQPIVGPFLSAAARGLSFRYSDTTGAPLALPVVDPARIALIDIELRAEGRGKGIARRVDSTLLSVALRGRR